MVKNEEEKFTEEEWRTGTRVVWTEGGNGVYFESCELCIDDYGHGERKAAV